MVPKPYLKPLEAGFGAQDQPIDVTDLTDNEHSAGDSDVSSLQIDWEVLVPTAVPDRTPTLGPVAGPSRLSENFDAVKGKESATSKRKSRSPQKRPIASGQSRRPSTLRPGELTYVSSSSDEAPSTVRRAATLKEWPKQQPPIASTASPASYAIPPTQLRAVIIDDDLNFEMISTTDACGTSSSMSPIKQSPVGSITALSAGALGSWGNPVPFRPMNEETPDSALVIPLGTWGNPVQYLSDTRPKRAVSPASPSEDETPIITRRRLKGKGRRVEATPEYASPSLGPTLVPLPPKRTGPSWTVRTPEILYSAPPMPNPPELDYEKGLASLPSLDSGDILDPRSSLTKESLLLPSAGAPYLLDRLATKPVPISAVSQLNDSYLTINLASEVEPSLHTEPLHTADFSSASGDLDSNMPFSPSRRAVEAAVEGVRIGVGDVGLSVTSFSPSSPSSPWMTIDASGSKVTSSSPGVIPAFRSLTGGKSALEYLRERSQKRMSSTESPSPAEPSLKPQREMMSRKEWRRIVQLEGETDIDVLLESDSDALSSARSMGYESVDLSLDTHHLSSGASEQPPVERRGTAIRQFDSTMIDEWNRRRPFMTKNPALHRAIFEAYIATSELDAGEIGVINDIDSEGAPPDFEFQCSNEMLYNFDVPDPEMGLGCTCDGPCDPASKSCTCVKRQEAYFYDLDMKGFAYTEDGKIKNNSTVVWECGETCGCPPSCTNRVIQRGRSSQTKIDLFKTEYKGWGVQARDKIPWGTFIGVYAGEMISESESERRGNIYAECGRTYLFDCDGWQIRHAPTKLAEIDPRLAQIAGEAAERGRIAAKLNDEKVGEYPYSAFSVDAFHYGYTRFFNHCCDPNLEITQAYVKDFHPERPMLVIFSRRDILPGEELCISYKGINDEEPLIPMPVVISRKNPKRRGRKLAKTSASVHVPTRRTKQEKQDKDRCMCGAAICDGKMFNLSLDT